MEELLRDTSSDHEDSEREAGENIRYAFKQALNMNLLFKGDLNLMIKALQGIIIMYSDIEHESSEAVNSYYITYVSYAMKALQSLKEEESYSTKSLYICAFLFCLIISSIVIVFKIVSK